MAVELKNPPIVEAWIDATFRPEPESSWSWDEVEDVLQSFGGEFEVFEWLPGWTPEAKKFDKDKIPTEFQIHVEPRFLRTLDQARSQIVQIGKNKLVVTHIRQDGESYPGFSKLLGSFLNAFDSYCKQLRVVGIESLQSHYVDIVTVPNLIDGETNIQDLFVGAPQLPEEPFGSLVDVSWSITFTPSDSPIVAQLSVQMQPPEGNDGIFRLDWHCWAEEIQSLDQDAIAASLRAAHNYVLKCFQASFKPRVWQLFSPTQ